MHRQLSTNAGVSLLETLLASVIFVIAMSAMFATLDKIRQPVVNNNRTMGAVLYGKNLLESMRANVDSRDYNTGALKIGTTGPVGLPTYSIMYTVSCADGTTSPPCNAARKVVMQINDTP